MISLYIAFVFCFYILFLCIVYYTSKLYIIFKNILLKTFLDLKMFKDFYLNNIKIISQ